MKLKNFIILILMLLCIESKAQTTVVNVDSSNTVNIYNYGTVIENDRGTVNIGTDRNQDNCKSNKRCNKSIESECKKYDPWDWKVGFITIAISIGFILLGVLIFFLAGEDDEVAEILTVGPILAFFGIGLGGGIALGVIPVTILHFVLVIIDLIIQYIIDHN